LWKRSATSGRTNPATKCVLFWSNHSYIFREEPPLTTTIALCLSSIFFLQRGAGRTFKKTIDNEDTRRSREETALQIRKVKKDARLAKRRQMPTGGLGPMTGGDPNTPMRNSNNNAATSVSAAANLENLPAMINGVMGHDPSAQLEYTTYFRRLLSIEKNPPIQQVIASGVVPRFVEFLNRDDNPPLQFEAAWALT
jgi:importin subunit alpha-6/7